MVDEELCSKISSLLKSKGLTVATAESCTGGLLASVLTDFSGSSDYFMCGVVSYSNSAKMDLLGVPLEDIKCFGAVSEAVARSMAEGVRKKIGVDVGISTTGIAGPTGGTVDKPVGLVFIGVSTRDETLVKRFVFDGGRLENKNSSCEAALKMVLEIFQ